MNVTEFLQKTIDQLNFIQIGDYVVYNGKVFFVKNIPCFQWRTFGDCDYIYSYDFNEVKEKNWRIMGYDLIYVEDNQLHYTMYDLFKVQFEKYDDLKHTSLKIQKEKIGLLLRLKELIIKEEE